ncbi:hypothetical protein SAMN02745148_02072 [Modicisalibacter ilicicola DSM 19980]|uniref:DUF6969 domain-containing protein n=1 Tax=Modicisalibacter ilicicola DSM 19980 TaxID=1121942 RepID=A0A1M4ZUR1_9GAMM|nr:hypothetical protein [Halomonas ilicicola]SHF21840.1 hypothetical protein SAMN02745148_02072 [Halomonas ilicicola DSM 19980]
MSAVLPSYCIAEAICEPTLADHAEADLRRMHEAAQEALKCQRVLKKVGLNLVGELLKGQGEFLEFNHFPDGDVYDRDTGSQYYYHAHRGSGEHGHFHVFHRPPEDNRPGELADPTHLVAISMDAWGEPIGLFTTNRWVTGETWRNAADTLALARAFELDHAWPSWPVNRWVSAMIVAFYPYLEVLIEHRDREIAVLEQSGIQDVHENRAFEVIGQLPISLPGWEKRLAARLK